MAETIKIADKVEILSEVVDHKELIIISNRKDETLIEIVEAVMAEVAVMGADVLVAVSMVMLL